MRGEMPGTTAQLRKPLLGRWADPACFGNPVPQRCQSGVPPGVSTQEWWVRVLAAWGDRGQSLGFPVCGSGGHLEGVLAGARAASGLAGAGGEGRAKPSAPALFSPEPALRDRGSGGDDSMGGPRAWTLLCLGLLLPGGGAAWSVPGARFSGRR